MRSLLIPIILLSLAALASPAPAAAADTAADGPVLGPDTLSPEQRADMEAEIAAIQAEADRHGHAWTAGETSVMRLSREERDRRLIHTPWPEPVRGAEADYRPRGFDREANGIDWRNNDGDFVTGVRNQGDCGSCWDFAATAALESAFLISIGGGNVPMFDLSEQHVLSCMDDYGFGSDCGGGNASDVNWFAVNVGMIEEFCLPYTGNDSYPCGQVCDDVDDRTCTFDDYGTVCYGYNIQAIKDALHNHGPVATTMTVYDSFDAYTGGIYQASGSVTGYHAVAIIGYNEDQQYWIGKNSWGEGWGMGGFFFMHFNSGCSFGDWTTWASHDASEMGSFAAFRVEDRRPKTGEPVHFYDRSVEINAVITSWEWDFDGDGLVDATGPGPHAHVFTEPGVVSPRLRITDSSGGEDIADYTDFLTLVFDGPVWIVDAVNGSDYGDGSPGNPLMRIQTGMNVAVDGDTILVKPGVYSGIMNNELRAYGKNYVLRGEGEPGQVIIDGLGVDRLFILDDGEGPGCSIENLTIRNGHDDFAGGAVYIENARPSFVDVRFEDNTVGPDPSARGGAVWCNDASVFTGCVFTNNAAVASGGALHAEGGVCALIDCAFADNAAALGGAVQVSAAGTLTVAGGEFTGNAAQEKGGAIHLTGHGELDACLLRANEVLGTGASCGGGAVALSGASAALELRNGILADNAAPMGGAVHVGGAPLVVEHASFWNNQASVAGGALVSFTAEIAVANSIFWSDDALNDPEILAPLAGADAIRACIVQGGFAGEGILESDPLFADPLNDDFTLDEGSPAIGAGLTEIALPADFLGEPRPRPASSPPDLGACESPLGTVVGVEEERPATARFVGIYPNPFNPTTTISFSLDEESDVRLQIYHTTGRLVATLIESPLGPGRHDISWTAADADDQRLASGLFLVRLECRYPDGREEIEMQKAILIK